MTQDVTSILRREEQITLYLRGLYERCGFRKYRMSKFEEYDLYLENKNFLKSPNIITFHDLDGRVRAHVIAAADPRTGVVPVPDAFLAPGHDDLPAFL